MIGINWTLYTYSVVSGLILAASFGYYLNPLANVLLGRFVLKERLSWLQWAAVGIAAAGILALIGGVPQAEPAAQAPDASGASESKPIRVGRSNATDSPAVPCLISSW